MKLFFTRSILLFSILILSMLCSPLYSQESSTGAEKQTSAESSQQSPIELNKLAYEKIKAGEYNLAFQLADTARDWSIRLNNQGELARALSNMGASLRYVGDFESALRYLRQSLTVTQQNGDAWGEERALTNIGNLYIELGNNDESKHKKNNKQTYQEAKDYYLEAQDYYQKALDVNAPENTQTTRTQLIINLALAHALLKEHDKAQLLFDEVNNYVSHIEDEFTLIFFYRIQGKAAMQRKDYESALEHYRQAHSIAQQTKYSGQLMASQLDLAQVYFDEGKFALAEEFALLAVNNARQQGYRQKELNAHKLLVTYYKYAQDYAKALFHLESATILTEILHNKKAAQFAEIVRIDRQVNENEKALQRMNEAQKYARLKYEKSRSQLILTMIVVILVALLVTIMFVWRARVKELKQELTFTDKSEQLNTFKKQIQDKTAREFQRPLQQITHYINDMLKDPLALPNNAKQSAYKVQLNAQKLNRLVLDILTLSQIRIGSLKLHLEPTQIQPLVDEVFHDLKNNLSSEKVELKHELTSNTSMVHADPERISQVLYRLVSNAIKFTHYGHICIRASELEDYLRISIVDTGEGIDARLLEQINDYLNHPGNLFEIKVAGIGIGLQLSKNIVELHGGYIEVESRLEMGTQVTIAIPLAKN
ncbi:tetratricopeptide repeat-containing sensor histidine kinase [Pleionea sp. CnH1-48]|uniref:tetratricopeptide repeat-containing sensor histidine kinase n=1 Tax=Pleionea sp. CnH1-48 TaxID=2954494 RepID=UPI0020982955|nr:tetratricopeptide repeat-containing sensor histidine kinase [Pleionea sp. CnH1-48]MCO7222928.1 tetratricopeptide repeat-containing sensor histidine kinase [Pleionea sp. CnH1-48]